MLGLKSKDEANIKKKKVKEERRERGADRESGRQNREGNLLQ